MWLPHQSALFHVLSVQLLQVLIVEDVGDEGQLCGLVPLTEPCILSLMTSKHVIIGLVFLRVLILVGFLAGKGRVLLVIFS